MGAVCIVAVIATWETWRPTTDIPTLVLGSLVIVGMSAFAVRTISGTEANWSAAVFVHLAMSIALGPPGAVASAVADGLMGRLIVSPGLSRGLFNSAVFVLTNLSAWWTFHLFGSLASPAALVAAAGLSAGAVAWIVDHVLVAVVIAIASSGVSPVRQSMQSGLAVIPHTLAAGLAASGVTLLYHQAGLLGFTMFLVPIFSAQAFLVLLARRTSFHLQELQAAQEEERRRIARDLHDSVVQTVVGYSMRLSAGSSSLSQQFGEAASRWTGLLDNAGRDLRGAAKDLRTLIFEIAPPSLEDEGLAEALTTVATPLRDAGVEIDLHIDRELDIVRADRTLLFRVAQEAFRNIAKHANAQHVRLQIARDRDQVVLKVTDDGVGFRPDELTHRRREGHVGTRGLEEISAQRGATLTIDSTPGEGTHLCLAIPLT